MSISKIDLLNNCYMGFESLYDYKESASLSALNEYSE